MLTGSGKKVERRSANGDAGAAGARKRRASLWRNEKCQVRLGLGNLLSLLAGVVCAWLWVALSSQHCGPGGLNVLLGPAEEIEDALWAEGERAAREIHAKLAAGASFELRLTGANATVSDAASKPPDLSNWPDPDEWPPDPDTEAELIYPPPHPKSYVRNLSFEMSVSWDSWEEAFDLLRLWWRPNELSGHVWMPPPSDLDLRPGEKHRAPAGDPGLPEVRRSEPVKGRFEYTHPMGGRAMVGIARIVKEAYMLSGDEVHWFVLGNEDTLFAPDNLARVLSKYDHRELWYIGAPSETHHQNVVHSFGLAYTGGGFAVSWGLARALAHTLDDCLQRYPELYGSGSRVQACISELGVQVTQELGFHQFDLIGSLAGALESHPLTPFLGMRHVAASHSLAANESTSKTLRRAAQAALAQPLEFLQQSICVDASHNWSITVAWGFSVRWYPVTVRPVELEAARRTFVSWTRQRDPEVFDLDTRATTLLWSRAPAVFQAVSVFQRIEDGEVWLESVYRRVPTGRALSVSKLKRLAARRHNVTAEWFGRRRKRRKRDATADPSRDDDGLGVANLRDRKGGAAGRGLRAHAAQGLAYGREPKRSLEVVRVLKPPFEEDWVWYPRRSCCKSLTFLEEGTVAEIRLGPCTIDETLWKESIVAEGASFS